ncbi:hypothetical protein MYX75_13155 [Acidobacteria bacterium AH-259-A15]|nr:hypothetical protein [Acidobacteria bacterium AH-259-A15]
MAQKTVRVKVRLSGGALVLTVDPWKVTVEQEQADSIRWIWDDVQAVRIRGAQVSFRGRKPFQGTPSQIGSATTKAGATGHIKSQVPHGKYDYIIRLWVSFGKTATKRRIVIDPDYRVTA